MEELVAFRIPGEEEGVESGHGRGGEGGEGDDAPAAQVGGPSRDHQREDVEEARPFEDGQLAFGVELHQDAVPEAVEVAEEHDHRDGEEEFSRRGCAFFRREAARRLAGRRRHGSDEEGRGRGDHCEAEVRRGEVVLYRVLYGDGGGYRRGVELSRHAGRAQRDSRGPERRAAEEAAQSHRGEREEDSRPWLREYFRKRRRKDEQRRSGWDEYVFTSSRHPRPREQREEQVAASVYKHRRGVERGHRPRAEGVEVRVERKFGQEEHDRERGQIYERP